MTSTTPTQVTATIRRQNGMPASGTLTFTLSSFDLDNAVVIPQAVSVELSGNGEASVNLWPNVAGLKATSYAVTLAASPSQTINLGSVSIPESAMPVQLHNLVAIPNIGTAQFVVLASQAAYDALPTKNPNTHYLIPAAE